MADTYLQGKLPVFHECSLESYHESEASHHTVSLLLHMRSWCCIASYGGPSPRTAPAVTRKIHIMNNAQSPILLLAYRKPRPAGVVIYNHATHRNYCLVVGFSALQIQAPSINPQKNTANKSCFILSLFFPISIYGYWEASSSQRRGGMPPNGLTTTKQNQ